MNWIHFSLLGALLVALLMHMILFKEYDKSVFANSIRTIDSVAVQPTSQSKPTSNQNEGPKMTAAASSEELNRTTEKGPTGVTSTRAITTSGANNTGNMMAQPNSDKSQARNSSTVGDFKGRYNSINQPKDRYDSIHENQSGILGNDSIRIWIPEGHNLNRSDLVLAYTFSNPKFESFRGGHVYIPHFEVYHCVPNRTRSEQKECPREMENSSLTRLNGFERDLDWNLLTIYDNRIDNSLLLQHKPPIYNITYFDGKKPILIDPALIRVLNCKGTNYCQTKQYLACPHGDSYWDMFDYQCKPFQRGTTRSHGWWAPCSCETTCMTKITTENFQLYPYANEGDYTKFATRHKHEFPDRYPLHITGYPMDDVNYTSACQVLRGEQQRTDINTTKTHLEASRFRHVAFSHHFVFIPQLKLAYCGVPKVGMTEWLKFFRYVLGANDYLGFAHAKEDLKQFHMKRLSADAASAILTDPNWTKAIFLRDPAERLLSAYLDKIMKEDYTQRHFMRIAETNISQKGPNYRLNFSDFIDLIKYTDYNQTPPAKMFGKPDPRGMHRMTDPHWKPQLWTCGMNEVFPLMDFVGNFHHFGEHTKLLLSKLKIENDTSNNNAWTKWGKTYDSTPSKTARRSICHQVSQRSVDLAAANATSEKLPALSGFNQRSERQDASYKHSTGAAALMEQYYTPTLLKKVEEVYRMDYEIWNEIKELPSHQVPAARDLKAIQNVCKLSSSR